LAGDHDRDPLPSAAGLLPDQALTEHQEGNGAFSRGRGRVVVTGAAGLVGQNLIPRLKAHGFNEIIAIDKHPANSAILRKLHSDIRLIEADLAYDDSWQDALAGVHALISCHAQIGGVDPAAYIANNITATERVIGAAKATNVPYVVQISSSVVNSAVVDYYTETKKAQEQIALESGMPCVVLRPTLMFGWFDRKHLGWLVRFMGRAPAFPIPGHGRYLRQPLYAGDFCDIIVACLEQQVTGTYNITGLQRIDYIDLIRTVRDTLNLRRPIVKVPYRLFWGMLRACSMLDKDPPFTTKQLEALVTPDVFEVIDWPNIFGVSATPLADALRQTYLHPQYSKIVLEF
jgi:nucleoside-diphosphate-sugar epimerase